MNIDELQPGPELDRLIAEGVMGYKVFRWGDPDDLFVASSRAAFDYACTGDTLTCYTDSEKGFCFTMPKYSTDIVAAWSVIEKMQQLGYRVTIELREARELHPRVSFNNRLEDADKFTSAETAQLAICRAALKAVCE